MHRALTSNSAYGFALILSVLLSGLGIGGVIQWRWLRRRHIGYWTGVETAALSHYLKGGCLLPDDPACLELVRASYFRIRKAEENLSVPPVPSPLPPAGN
jgi:hypothetical protein